MSEYWSLRNESQGIEYLNTVDGVFTNTGLSNILDVYDQDWLWYQEKDQDCNLSGLIDRGFVKPLKKADFQKIIDFLRSAINRRVRELVPNYEGEYDTEGFYFIDAESDDSPSDMDISDLRALYIAFLEMEHDSKPSDICLVVSD